MLPVTGPVKPTDPGTRAGTVATAIPDRQTRAAEAGSRHGWLRPALLVAVLIVLAGGAYVASERFVLPKRTAPASASGDKSIAVLPFVDMSEKKDQEYFADGMAEEILDILAKVPSLKVVVRMDSAAGSIMAAPNPWASRAPISTPESGASPPVSDML